MFNLLCKKQLIIAGSNVRGFSGPTRFLELPQNASFMIRLFSSTIRSDGKEQSFTVSYLISSCGLSPEAADVASKKINLKSLKKSDSLLALLRNHGFSDAHIPKMVTTVPSILLAHPQDTVLPKLQFFHSIGVPAPILAKMISRNPVILRCSLQNRIIPFYDYLKNLLEMDERVISVFKRSSVYFVVAALQRLPSNVEILNKYGVSKSNIVFLVVHHPKPLMTRSDKLVKLVDRVIGLGIDISKLIFVQAIQVLHCTSQSAWEHRKNVYRKWGWSESDIFMAFSVHPICMSLSEKKIMSAMEFLVNEMSCQPTAIARYPIVLCYSLGKRIKPRCRVVKILVAKGLIKKSYSICSFLYVTDKMFLKKFVDKYQEEIPQLLDVYHGKLSSNYC